MRKMDVKGFASDASQEWGADASVDRSRGSWRAHARQRGDGNGRGNAGRAEDNRAEDNRAQDRRLEGSRHEDSGLRRLRVPGPGPLAGLPAPPPPPPPPPP